MIRVFVGQPYDHIMEPESEAAGRAGTLRKGDVKIKVQRRHETCLIARSFNMCLADCRNEGNYDYFGLLHSDVAADPGWVDTLMEEMDKSGADIIHAVAAIKNMHGLTSTALAYSDDEWAPVRKITTSELQTLPETFDIDALRECYDSEAVRLLPNTGCLLMRCGEWFDSFPGFAVLDRMIFDGDKWQAQTVPEDWNLGHWAARNGVKVVGTRVVVTEHWGRAPYPSNQAWGMEVDPYYERWRKELVAV